MSAGRGVALAGGAGLLAGCTRPLALDPAAWQAERIADLWWLFLAVTGTVYVAVLVALAWALLRRRAAPEASAAAPQRERRMALVVGSLTGGSALLLLALLVASIDTGHALADEKRETRTIEITGHQWWWEIRYPVTPAEGNDVARTVTTANELHLPVGQTVRLRLESADVIHSFWVPRLHGKRDLIPGRTTWLWLRPEQVGQLEGFCAEFCGVQHAHMALRTVVEPPAAFAAWMQAQAAPAFAPTTEVQELGQKVFMSRSCALCHAIGGTPAGGRVGPDLTHLASRRTIAAGTLLNRRGHLGGWVIDAQSSKPGTNMPTSPLPGDELQALLAYLESLR